MFTLMTSQMTLFDNDPNYYVPKYYFVLGGYVDDRLYSEHERELYLAGEHDPDAKFISVDDWTKMNLAVAQY